MNVAERHAKERVENLTKTIAGCLTPMTLQLVIDEIEDNTPEPVPEDLARFVDRMAVQLDSLIYARPRHRVTRQKAYVGFFARVDADNQLISGPSGFSGGATIQRPRLYCTPEAAIEAAKATGTEAVELISGD